MSFSRVLWRMVVASIGFLAAVFASLVVAALGFGTVEAGERLIVGDASGLLALAAGLLRSVTVLPVLSEIVWPLWGIAIALGEATATRGLVVHLVVAAAIAVVGLLGGAPLVGVAHLQVIAATGLVGGFAHWLVAGHGAGLRPSARTASLEGDPRPPHDGTA
ncbi:MAG: hypothetical protein ABTQ29_08740 [Siculibacillus sp.]